MKKTQNSYICAKGCGKNTSGSGETLQAVYTYGQYIDEPLSMDHVPTSQPTSQPASQPAALQTLNSELITQNSLTPTPEILVSPMATPLSLTEGEVGVPGTPGEGAATPTVPPLQTVPPDPYATEAAAMLTPPPTDTPIAMATVPPDPYATQAAQMTESSTPAPQATAAQVQSIPQVITSPTPTAIQVQILSTTSQPSLERYYYHANRLYSVATLTDSQGNVVERYQYNAYGLCTTFNANYELPLAFSRFGNPYTYTGRELDPETDLMHYRTRPYSLRQGRFVTKDLIGYSGGINLYNYVSNRPYAELDPFGLTEFEIKIPEWLGGGVWRSVPLYIPFIDTLPYTYESYCQGADEKIANAVARAPDPVTKVGVKCLGFIAKYGPKIQAIYTASVALNDIKNLIYPPEPPPPPGGGNLPQPPTPGGENPPPPAGENPPVTPDAEGKKDPCPEGFRQIGPNTWIGTITIPGSPKPSDRGPFGPITDPPGQSPGSDRGPLGPMPNPDWPPPVHPRDLN